ncbi:hypothetical protein F5B17DRAFT_445357 [Nemania serpens]|nr:hypothetical protein F5B17DRAFT_445357 [Nemania serpens]
MDSPRTTTPENWTSSPQPSYPNGPTPPHTPPTDPIWQLEELDAFLADLAQAAAQCYAERLDYDMQSVIFRPRDAEEENYRANVDAKLTAIRDRAEVFETKRFVLRSELAPYLNSQVSTPNSRSPSHSHSPSYPHSHSYSHSYSHSHSNPNPNPDPLDDLETVFLQIEQQRLAGVIGTINHVDEQFARTRADIEEMQDPAVRDAFDGALERLQLALWDFRRVFDDFGRERGRVIDNELMRIASGPSWSRSCSPFSASLSPSSSSLPEDTDSGLGRSSSSSEMELNMSMGMDMDTALSVSLDPLAISPSGAAEQVCETMPPRSAGEEEYMTERLFRFDRNDPPTLLRLANWLGLDDAVHAAILLNSGPIQNAFATYSASRREGGSIAKNPEKLKLVLALDVLSRETLLAWCDGAGSGREKRNETTETWRGVDFDAALFANLVVRYLENGCDEVEWEPLAERVAGFKDYDDAKRRWAVVLQMLWFLEKAFAPVEREGEGAIFI